MSEIDRDVIDGWSSRGAIESEGEQSDLGLFGGDHTGDLAAG